jgi:uncharacterized membrane protein
MALFQEEDANGSRLTVRPNCALSWRWTKRVFLFSATCLTAVAWYFASLGAWLVVPFAGLELAVLAIGFYLSALAGNTREVIEIRADELRLLRGNKRLQQFASLSRVWTRVLLVRDPNGRHPSRLFLRCHGRRIEIRTRLVESEREELAYLIERMLGNGVRPATETSPVPTAVEIPAGFREGEARPMTRNRFSGCAEEIATSANRAYPQE